MRRAYFFTNMYLSQIQRGIQAGHVIGEMSIKYDHCSDFYKWALYNKTMIVLNGGMNDNLEKITELFNNNENPYNWAYFQESEEALNCAVTCVGIILPENIYDIASDIRAKSVMVDWNSISEWEIELIEIINSCRLA